MGDSREPMSDEALQQVAKRFAVLAEPMRLRLLQSLISGEKNVNTLVTESGGTQANVSRHLQTLARDGLLTRRREGLQVFYAVADKSIFSICDIVCGSIREGLKKRSEAMGEG
jgi:ArsR family transcriptional regulator